MKGFISSSWFVVLAAAALLAAYGGCGGAQGGSYVTLEKSGADPATSTAGSPITITVVAKEGGAPKQGVVVDFSVELGGGSITTSSAATAADGTASVSWTIGKPPVRNAARAAVRGADAGAAVVFETMAKVNTPYTPEWFADVNKYMTDQAPPLTGSTEDLAISNDGKKIYLAVPDHLLTVEADGKVAEAAIDGDPLIAPLGIDFDTKGNLWVADSAGALRVVSPAGVVTTALTTDGSGNALKAPNFVMVGADGRIYFSDPCLGKVMRYDPVSKLVDASLTVDHVTLGGPNGIAIDATGKKMYFSTENTSIMCKHGDVKINDRNSALLVADISESGFGDPVPIKKDFAHFGDGMTFDAEGNLYVIFDNIDFNLFALKDSTVWVMPAGTTTLSKFISTGDRVLANMEFGKGDFSTTTIYFALLATIGVPAEARGLNSFQAGQEGGNR